tara:strand:- start:703 stop:1080 length:378 start_codon:yes stop_codon:yes gene_type:complete
MFRVNRSDEGIKWPVHINEPRSGGAVKQHTINVHFIIKGQETIDELTNGSDLEFMLAVIDPVKGWEGLTRESSTNEKGVEEIPYNETELEALLDIPYIKAGFIEAYFKCIAGVSSKNSGKRQRTG